jgi:2-oxo-4-hydroxy-4-carboxy-5-ureidoimidazoline decarboxylase
MQTEPGEMGHTEFLETFGQVFEHSPWIAQNVWDYGLDRRQDTAAGMHDFMCNEIRQAEVESQLELIRSHPELACSKGPEGMTPTSHLEQRLSGLDECSREEFDEFQKLNKAYLEKFGFPFILAIKGFQRSKILDIFRSRIEHSAEEEFQIALAQVMRIGLFRLQDIYA